MLLTHMQQVSVLYSRPCSGGQTSPGHVTLPHVWLMHLDDTLPDAHPEASIVLGCVSTGAGYSLCYSQFFLHSHAVHRQGLSEVLVELHSPACSWLAAEKALAGAEQPDSCLAVNRARAAILVAK